MTKIGIITDSVGMLSNEFKEKHDVTCVPLSVIIDDDTFIDGVTIDNKLLFGKLDEGKMASTSQPTPNAFLDAYNKLSSEYDEILVILISSKLSGTYQSALIARDLYEGNANIAIIDSLNGAMGEEILIKLAVDMHNNGKNINEIEIELNSIKHNVELYVTIDDLTSLVRGGRLSKTQATIGNLLNVKPLLKLKNGKLVFSDKIRTKKKVYKKMIESLINSIKGKENVIVRIGYTDSLSNAIELKEMIEEVNHDIDVEISGVIGPVLSVHVGTGGLGLAWYSN